MSIDAPEPSGGDGRPRRRLKRQTALRSPQQMAEAQEQIKLGYHTIMIDRNDQTLSPAYHGSRRAEVLDRLDQQKHWEMGNNNSGK